MSFRTPAECYVWRHRKPELRSRNVASDGCYSSVSCNIIFSANLPFGWLKMPQWIEENILKNIFQLILGFGMIILVLLILSISHTNPDSTESLIITNDIIRSKVAFAMVDEEIARHLNLGALSEQDLWKLRGPVLLHIRTAIHFQLREHFGKIVNTVDFRTQLGPGSLSESSLNRTVLHEKVTEVIRDFIASKHISVIIMSDRPIGIGEETVLRGLRGEMRHTYNAINGACVILPISNITALIKRPFVQEIWPDSNGIPTLDQSVKDIGADKVHNPPSGELGVTGEGVRVAVVDTGIDQSHPEFQDQVIDKRQDPLNNAGIVDGHGTHVAGIIASTAGVAPKVKLLDGRIHNLNLLTLEDFILENFLNGNDSIYSDTIDAIEWASHKKWFFNAKEKADIINLSYAFPQWIYGREGNDPMSQLIDEVVSDDGVTFVVAAGNFARNREIGVILPNSDPLSHRFQIGFTDNQGRVTQSVKLIFTLMWDDKDNDLDLVIMDSKNQAVALSRSNPGFILGETYYDKSRYGTTKYYEQLILEFNYGSQSNETYKFQVEAADVQVSQDYEVFIGGVDYGSAIFNAPNKEKTVSVPGYSKKAITVGAIISGTQLTSYSSQGPSDTNNIKPEVVAPGENIRSTILSSTYGINSGTSIAAPHVSGVAALILDAVGKNNSGKWNFSPDEVKSAIVFGAEGLSNMPDNTYGAGLVKADNIIFGGTVEPEGMLRFEITRRLTSLNYGDYDLNADPSLKVAISWQETADNLDLVLSDADGNTLLESEQTASNYEKIDGSLLSVQSETYYLDVHNGSQKSVAFTGAATHPIKSSVDSTQPLPTVDSDLSLSANSTQEARLRVTLKGHTDFVSSVAFSPDGRTLASGSWDDTIRLWNPRTEEHLATLTGHTDRVTSVAFSPNSNMLASGCWDRTVRFWNPLTGKYIRNTYSVNTRNETFTSVVAASSDGDSYWFASGSLDNNVWLWYGYGLTVNTRKYRLPGHTHDVSSVAFSADERTLASGSHDNTVKLWYVSTKKLRVTLKGHTDFVTSVAFSPDGRTLASGSWDNTIRLWDVAAGKSTKTLSGHTDRVLSVAFSSDGRTLASGSDDQTIRLWDVATGQQRDTLLGHTSGVTAVAFSPDRRTLASAGGWDNTLRLWDLSPAPTPAPTVRITPSPVVSPDVGDNLVLKIDVSGVENVAGYQATVRFDPTALHYVESANGSYLPAGSLFVPPVVNANQVTLAATSLSGDSDGAGTLATLTFEVVAVKPSYIALSDVMIMQQDLTSIPIIVKNGDIVVTSDEALDVNGDGIVNILDLIVVATHFGTVGESQADVNGDSVVDIKDLLLVAGGLNADAAAPSTYSMAISALTVEEIQMWLGQAQQLGLSDATYQRGFTVLQQLLIALTPKETALLPNYPNPFNPETWIPYQLAESADVTVTIYAVDGTMVRTLALGHQPVGIYQDKSRAAYWDGRILSVNLASGVYFYTLTAGEFTATRKMLIRK